MEFIEFLDRTEVEIIKMVEKAGYKTAENTKLCLLGENYVGYLNRRRKEIIIFVLVVWIIQIVWSKFWLNHYKQGPLEWFWRKLTYINGKN